MKDKKAKVRFEPEIHGAELELNLGGYDFRVEGDIVKACKKKAHPKVKELTMPVVDSAEYALLQLLQLRDEWYAQHGAPDWANASQVKHVINFMVIQTPEGLEVEPYFMQSWAGYNFFAFNKHEEAVAFYDEYKDLFSKLKRLIIWKEN